MINLFSLIALAFFIVLGIVVGLLNPTSVDINIFISTITLPLSIVMSVLFVIGMTVGGLIVFLQVIQYRWKLRTQLKDNQKLSNQIIELKKELIDKKEKKVKQEIQENKQAPQLVK